jgi:hypothetical protein
MDNLSSRSHTRKALVDRSARSRAASFVGSVDRPFHPNPWKVAESVLSPMSGNGAALVIGSLEREARAWNRQVNWKRVGINWNFDRKKARKKFKYKTKRSKT